jgi:hypothetical protein
MVKSWSGSDYNIGNSGYGGEIQKKIPTFTFSKTAFSDKMKKYIL